MLFNCSGAALISEYHRICAPENDICAPENDICEGWSDILGSPSYLNGGTSRKVATRGGVTQTNNLVIIIYLEKIIAFYFLAAD